MGDLRSQWQPHSGQVVVGWEEALEEAGVSSDEASSAAGAGGVSEDLW